MFTSIFSPRKPDFRVGGRAWVRGFFAGLSSWIALSALANFIIDPYQQYRRAGFYDVYFSRGEARYLNAGLAKTYDYKSVVIGTSHAANFRMAELRQKIFFRDPVKLIIPGASAYEKNITLAAVFDRGQVESVLYGLDPLSFTRADLSPGFPEYLYQDGISLHIRYLTAPATFVDAVAALRKSMWNPDDILFSYDRMYEWQHQKEKEFGSDHVLTDWNDAVRNIEGRPPEYSLQKLVAGFDGNILPYFRRYSDTDFIVFYPPYSILKYELMQREGVLTDYLDFKKHIFSATRDLDNVRLYDFQAAKEVTHNLDNYRDVRHYHQKFNSWMLEQIAANRYRVSEETVERYNSELLDQVVNFDPPLSDPERR